MEEFKCRPRPFFGPISGVTPSMKIQVNYANFAQTQPITDHAEHSVSKALRNFAGQVTRVEVHLMDDSDRGRSLDDKRCTLEVRLAGQHPIAVEERGGDLYAVISSAAKKMHRAVEHRIGRLHDARRSA